MKIWFPCIDAVGGIRSYTETLAVGLRDLGHDVTLTLFPTAWELAPRKLRGLQVPGDVDVVLADSWIAHAFVDAAPKLVSCEHHNVHAPEYKRFKSWPRRLAHEMWLSHYEARGFRAATATVAVSGFVADTVRRRFPWVEPKVIHNPVDTEFFTPSPDSRSSVSNGKVRLFFAGDLIPRKGADLLVEIVDRLGPQFELRYTAGNRTDVTLPARRGLQPLSNLTREEIRKEYRDSDIFLFPTRYESFGIATTEAMACGTAVVSSRGSAVDEVVTDGTTGKLCPVDDVSAFVAAVREFAEAPELRRTMGERAREDVVRRFDTKRVAENYETLLTKLVAAP